MALIPPPVIHVACGVLVRADGAVLLAQRPEGKIAAGCWEFPGGKIEPGESAQGALARELREELGVEVLASEPLIRFRHAYSNRTVVLDTWRVTAFAGEPHPCENQALRWLPAQDIPALAPQLPTVTPIVTALRLPAHYAFTPETTPLSALLPQLDALPPGALLRLRRPGLDDARYAHEAGQLAAAARVAGLQPVLDRTPQLARALACGLHLDGAALATCEQRPEGIWPLLASVHDAEQLSRAAALGLDAAVLGPVQRTASHAGATPLGWAGFAALRGALALPVYALGGLRPADLARARVEGAQGVAAIRAYWSRP